MAQTRSGIVKILKTEFEKNPQIAMQCIQSSTEALKEPHKISRIFDTFPCLLEESYINNLSERFIGILAQISSDILFVRKSAFSLKAMSQIQILESEIAMMGCAELLDKTGHVDPELSALLRWDPEKISQTDICVLICAYVGAVNATILSKKENIIKEQYPDAGASLFNFINKNYGRWSLGSLLESGRVFSPEQIKKVDVSIFEAILRFSKDNPALGVVIMGGVAGLLFFGAVKVGSHLASLAQANTNEMNSKMGYKQ